MTALRWESPTRFYRVRVQRDLFGDLSVLCVWGSKNSRHGNHKLIACADISEVRSVIRKIARVRKQHDYEFRPSRRARW